MATRWEAIRITADSRGHPVQEIIAGLEVSDTEVTFNIRAPSRWDAGALDALRAQLQVVISKHLEDIKGRTAVFRGDVTGPVGFIAVWYLKGRGITDFFLETPTGRLYLCGYGYET